MTVQRFILTIIFIQIVQVTSLTNDKLLKSQINDERHAAAFNRLLSSIAKVNQERLDSIKKLTRLQSLNPYPDFSESLRADFAHDDIEPSESDSGSDEDGNVVYLVIPDTSVHERANVSDDPVLPKNQPNNTDLLSIIDTRSRSSLPKRKKSTKVEKNQEENPLKVEEIKDDKHRNESITHLSLNNDGFEFLRQSIERSCRSNEEKRCKSACKEAVEQSCSVYDCKKKLKKSLKKNCKRACKDEFKNVW